MLSGVDLRDLTSLSKHMNIANLHYALLNEQFREWSVVCLGS